MDIRVNLYPFPADRHLKRLYSLYNMPRDWWAPSCVVKTHKQTKETDVDIIMDTLGTPDITDAFLLDPQGNVIMTWDQFQRASQRVQDVATEKGLCWAMYRKREVPWNLKYVMKLAPDVNWNEYIEDCTTYDHFYVSWKEEYGRCVDKQIVKFPELLKHSNRGTKDWSLSFILWYFAQIADSNFSTIIKKP